MAGTLHLSLGASSAMGKQDGWVLGLSLAVQGEDTGSIMSQPNKAESHGGACTQNQLDATAPLQQGMGKGMDSLYDQKLPGSSAVMSQQGKCL